MPFFIFSTQLALFFSKRVKPGPDLWIKLMKTPFGEQFVETIQMNQFPDDPQFDNAASVNMRTADKTARLTLSRVRADLFIDCPWDSTYNSVKTTLKTSFQDYTNAIQDLLRSDDVTINHVGFLNNFFCSDIDASRRITKLLKVNPTDLQGGSINNCGVRIETIDQINNYKVNNITRLDKANAAKAPTQAKADGILLVRDFNTLPSENTVPFDWDQIASFILKAEEKFQITTFEKLLADA